jgi:hypothetical protein
LNAEAPTPTESRLLRVALFFWPALAELDGEDLSRRLADVLGLLYGAPIALMGMGWLIAITDLLLIGSQWPLLLLFTGLMILLRRWPFSHLIKVGPGNYADWQESLDVIVSWSAALALGPTALWVTVLGVVIDHLLPGPQPPRAPLRWNRARSLVLDLAQVTAGLIALALYKRRAAPSLRPRSRYPASSQLWRPLCCGSSCIGSAGCLSSPIGHASSGRGGKATVSAVTWDT